MTDYTFTSRGRPPGYDGNDAIVVLGKLNNAGDFVGEAWKGSGDNYQSVSYLYKDSTYNPIDYPGASYTTARGINDRGQVVGRYEPDQNSDLARGFIYDGAKYTSLEVPGSLSNTANDINNSGTVVGSYKDTGGNPHGYIYNGGTYTTVDVPGAKTTYLSGVNDRGIAVGGYDTGSGVVSGFVYANGNVQTLNYPGASATSLSDISNDGTIVGLAYTQPTTSNPVGSVGFVYKNGVFNVVERAGEIAGINDSGQILAQTADRNISVSNPLCFGSGTLIRTTRGDVPVEALAVGDVAITATGARRPVCWIGRRTLDCAASPRPSAVWPVRVRAGAFGPGLPARDLRLSPGHPVLVGADADGRGGVLVPIMCLINGTTIEREPTATVTYWHVELDAHDLLLAEGFPAESYYDMGSRPWFAGADGPLVDPDFMPAGAHGRCRPVAVDGPLVEAERLRLSAVFAATLGAQCGWDAADSFAWLAA